MARYNCARASSCPRTKMSAPRSAGMVYLSPEGKKVTTPNEKRVEAEIKNRSEAMRLEFYKKQLDKEILRGKFLIKMEQKQALHALKAMMETSGNSPVSEPPSGPNDKDHEASPYFTGPARFSMKKLGKWRTEEKHLQRMLRDHESAQPPPDIARDAGYYKEFLEMINSLGLAHPENSKDDDIVIPHTLPATIEEEEEDEKTSAIERSSSLNPKSRLDVFECLKSESEKQADKVPKAEIRTVRLKRVQSAPAKIFSIRQWEKEITDNYVRSVSRPGSAKNPDTESIDIVDVGNTTRPKKSFRLRPSSAPVRMKFKKKQLPPTPEHGEERETSTQEKLKIRNTRRKSLPGEMSRQHLVPPNIKFTCQTGSSPYKIRNDPHLAVKNGNNSSAYGGWVNEKSKMDITSKNCEKGHKLQTARHKISMHLKKQKPPKPPTNMHSSKAQSFPNKKAPEKRLEVGKADDIPPQETKPLKKCLSSGNITKNKVSVNNVSFKSESVTNKSKNDNENNEEVGVEKDEIESDAEDDVDYVTHWKRDLSTEAPPSVFSTRVPIKIQLALSKVERQRELDKMVQDHSFAIDALVKKEKIRRVRQRLKAVATMEKVQDAATVAKKKLGRPRTDQDILRDIESL